MTVIDGYRPGVHSVEQATGCRSSDSGHVLHGVQQLLDTRGLSVDLPYIMPYMGITPIMVHNMVSSGQ